MSKPVAVIISDVHYSLATLELADNAFRQAIDKAWELEVPLIDAGDLTNDKAILRAEVINRLIATMKYAKSKYVPVYLIVGNHSLCNEKGKEHALEFLTEYVNKVIDQRFVLYHNGTLIARCVPYHTSVEELTHTLAGIPNGKTVICHQGIQGAWMGEYVVDKSAAPTELFSRFRTISGHYHRAQDIVTKENLNPNTGAVGLFSYIGTPYTVSFAEANDGPKGFRVLMDDGTLDFVPTNLRKHVIIETELSFLNLTLGVCANQVNPGDLIWLKLKGSTTELSKVNKEELGQTLFGHANYKLEKIYTDSPGLEPEHVANKTGEEILDNLIDSSDDSKEQKEHLKSLWKEIL